MHVQIEESWQQALRAEFEKPYFASLWQQVEAAYATETVYPPQNKLFAAFSHCPLSNISVVILGQDPYHGPGQAHGLAFSVSDNAKTPPSLRNIYKEIESDLSNPPPSSGNLTRWATQGVLLLNSSLSVLAGQPLSHTNLGWEQFTDTVIAAVSHQQSNVVFMLWGTFAQSKRALIDQSKHLVLTAPHPSPLSAYRGFFGCRHFSQCNDYLLAHHKQPIRW
jgi:uracil-DNA glycosylase